MPDDEGEEVMEGEKQLSTCKKPIQRGLNLGMMLFVLVIGIVMGYLSFRGYRDSIRHDYKVHLKGIMDFVATQIDADDLETCIRTTNPSPKFWQLQELLDHIADTMDVVYVYIFVPLNETGLDSAKYVITSNSQEDYEVGDVRYALGELSGEEFPEQVSRDNMRAYQSDSVTYFVTRTQWGEQYTAAMPLYNSAGEKYALICADINYSAILKMACRYAILSMLLVAFIGYIAISLLMRWIAKNITGPIRELEERALDFANSCDGQTDISSVVFEEPTLHTENEVESLTRAIRQMSFSMQHYVKDFLQAEERAADARRETKAMSKLAYQDTLTHVKSKAAYEEAKVRLEEDIEQNQAQFAFVMMDINNLKGINDTYGHDHGDEYIIGACHIVCDIYVHSSVFRMGGDEFVVLLKGRDYDRRELLLRKLRERLAEAATDSTADVWRRYSAATGMAEYEDGDTVESVLKRADEEMYRNKKVMKL